MGILHFGDNGKVKVTLNMLLGKSCINLLLISIAF